MQTVVLPQGEFASFLGAKPEDRGALLQKVFGTQHFDALAERLKVMAGESRRSVDAAEQRIGTAVAAFAEAAALDEPAPDAVETTRIDDRSGAALLDLVGSRVGDLREQAFVRSVGESDARVAADARRRELDVARATSDLLARRESLRSRQAELTARTDEMSRRRDRLEVAGRAALVMSSLQGARAAEAALVEAVEQRDVARAALPPALATGSVEDLEARLSAMSDLLARIDALRETGRSLPTWEGKRVDAMKEIARLDDELRILDDTLDGTRPAERAQLVGARQEFALGADVLGDARARAVGAADVLEAARDVVRIDDELAAARAALALAADSARSATAALTSARERRITEMAGELATNLAPGEPCAVCGSTEHPAPAIRPDDHVSADDIEVLEAAYAECDRHLVDASNRVAVLEGRREDRVRASEGTGVDAAQAADAEARAAVAATETAAARRDDADAQIERFDAKTDELRRTRDGLGPQRAELEGEARALAASIAQGRASLDRELETALTLLPGTPAIEAAKDSEAGTDLAAVVDREIGRAKSAVRAVLTGENEVGVARATAANRHDELTDGLAAQGFDDAAQALAGVLEPDERESAAAALRDHDADVRLVREALGSPEIAGLGDAVEVDLEAAVDALAAAVARHEEAFAQLERVRSTVQRAESAAAALRSAVTATAAVRSSAAPVLRMAEIANGAGDNADRITLQTFVLMRRFDEVVAAANLRLDEISGARYELARTDRAEVARLRKTGLSLTVRDHETGEERRPSTLSGGETFYVSLCLALGMADVVQAEAGGVELQTLFVDEGFGTLDPETLESVLGVLGRLSSGGRAVGLVSHVETLKQAVAERVSVRKIRGEGSTLTVVA
ncbi:nuclease SbcCD subunit C [Paraoerskovia sediminicola]|uniref:Nuclease SbcCD subunit C n=1 Tax=Paraoerskovia sediminicola TaxID=1138587 RepID=A0ABN6XBJ5_9CELL|nr:SbcC/MukB-like Walker B domain-containing protein [Paraoerskovia sediminicola]BDZ42221.1 nuclease SbcCD subunit C [Paraoerskovia sediminicola]